MNQYTLQGAVWILSDELQLMLNPLGFIVKVNIDWEDVLRQLNKIGDRNE